MTDCLKRFVSLRKRGGLNGRFHKLIWKDFEVLIAVVNVETRRAASPNANTTIAKNDQKTASESTKSKIKNSNAIITR